MGKAAEHRKKEFFLLLGLFFIMFASQFSFSYEQGPNNRNVSVDAKVNVTGSSPTILGVFVLNPITLTAGGLRTITCNASIQDFNGFGDIDTVQARFFSTTQSSVSDPEDNNTHYRNDSCSPIAGQESGSLANYTCRIDLNYYAVNTSWNCTVIVNDTIDLRDNETNNSLINQLLAVNVSSLIDYGNMAMGDTSDNETANVTNLGNVPINVSVRGYGGFSNQTSFDGDGLSFVCEQGNLSVGLQHFSSNISANYTSKQALTNAFQQFLNLTIAKATSANWSNYTTYWQLFLNTSENAFGQCNGTVVFQAEASQ